MPVATTRNELHPDSQRVATIFGAGFGAGLYRNLVQLYAFPCKVQDARILLSINQLCSPLQALATRCKGAENGLKIRRGQPRGGPPPRSRHQELSRLEVPL